jgi:protein phosphatase 1L
MEAPREMGQDDERAEKEKRGKERERQKERERVYKVNYMSGRWKR